jgi:hypothetical protein
MSGSHAERAFEFLGQFLDTEGLEPTRVPDQTAYEFAVEGNHAILETTVRVDLGAQQLVFYVHSPTGPIPEDRHTATIEFLTHANYGLRIGNFEFDLGQGLVRFKSSIDFEDLFLSDTTLRNALAPAVNSMDTYLPGLQAVISGLEPTAAVEMVEG